MADAVMTIGSVSSPEPDDTSAVLTVPGLVRTDVRYPCGTGVSDESECELACGQTSFLNVLRAATAPT
jgi:hypothetical protein